MHSRRMSNDVGASMLQLLQVCCFPCMLSSHSLACAVPCVLCLNIPLSTSTVACCSCCLTPRRCCPPPPTNPPVGLCAVSAQLVIKLLCMQGNNSAAAAAPEAPLVSLRSSSSSSELMMPFIPADVTPAVERLLQVSSIPLLFHSASRPVLSSLGSSLKARSLPSFGSQVGSQLSQSSLSTCV